jgi:hypothetical protein
MLLAVNLAIGLLAGRGHMKSTADHVACGRSLGFVLVSYEHRRDHSSVAFLDNLVGI